jgi:hypothetical protein
MGMRDRSDGLGGVVSHVVGCVDVEGTGVHAIYVTGHEDHVPGVS